MSAAVAAPIEDFQPQKKEVEVLKVLAEKVKGHVKWYSVSKCYGFISRSDDGGDLFVHRSVISNCARRFPSLRNGEEVEFSVVETSQGIEATCVTGPGGQPVKGSWPMYRRPRETSDPNQQGDSNEQQAQKPARAPRRRSNRRRSAGARGSKPNENGAETKEKTENGTGTDDAGESPTEGAPRQRRRPQRKNPRNRSAPTDGEREGNDEAVATQGDQRPRRFRRAFRPRGGGGGSMRYASNNWNAGQGWGGGYPENRFPTGDRNGFDRGVRRRNFRGRYPRGARSRPDGVARPSAEKPPAATVDAPSTDDNQIDDNLVKVANEVDILADQVEEVQIDEVLEPFMDAVDVHAEAEA